MTPRYEALEIAITQNDESPWNSRGFHWSADQTCHRRAATVVANGKPKAEAPSRRAHWRPSAWECSQVSRLKVYDFKAFHINCNNGPVARCGLAFCADSKRVGWEREADINRLRRYVTRWWCWLGGGLDGLVSRQGGPERTMRHILSTLHIVRQAREPPSRVRDG